MRFLVCLDESEFARTILPIARKFAVATEAFVEIITVVHPVHPGGEGRDRETARALSDSAAQEARERLRTAAALFDPPAEITALVGTSPGRTIVEHLRRTQPDLVLMATHSRGTFGEAALGSTARDVIRAGVTPVMVLHPLGVSGMNPADIPVGIPAFTSDGEVLGAVAKVTRSELCISRSGRPDLVLPVGTARVITAGHLALDLALADVERLAAAASHRG